MHLLFITDRRQTVIRDSKYLLTPMDRATLPHAKSPISFNSMGPTPTPTPTPTLGMRLSCNFVNVYTIAYRSTRLHVCTRASLTDNLARILARKSARVGRVDGQVGEDCRPCPARGKLNGEDVCVGVAVCVSVGPMMLTATD